MSYSKLIEILISDNVYNELKINEQKIFELIHELKVCKGFEQNNDWHIYDVYEHILHVVSNVNNNKCLRIAALFHDIGKPLVYNEDEKGVGHFYNHWNKSIEIFKKYKNKFDLNNEEITLIINLIFYHDVNIDKLNINEKNNLLNDIGSSNMDLLFSLKKADLLAQSPKYHYLLSKINDQENSLIEINNVIDSVITLNRIELNNLSQLVDDIIKSKTIDENIISHLYDRMLSLVFINEDEIKNIYFKLLNYTKVFNKDLSKDYENIFFEQYYEDNELNDDIIKILKK